MRQLTLLNNRFSFLGIGVAVVATLFLLSKVLGFGSICMFRNITGLSCPGCGMTHAAFALIKGEWLNAVNYNLLIFPVLLFSVIYLIFPKVLNNKILQITLLITFCGYYIWRMCFVFPNGSYPMFIEKANLINFFINSI